MTESSMVSICIPVYNGEYYLEKAILSALSQTYNNFELVIIDDGSSDRSHEIIKKYVSDDPRVRAFYNVSNLGLVRNWNKCISLASGEWIKFLFQDDVLDPHCLEKMLAAVNASHRNERIVFCRRSFIFEREVSGGYIENELKNAKFIWDFEPDKTVFAKEDVMRAITMWPATNVFGEPPSFIFRKEICDIYGYFDDSFHHACDLEYWLRVSVSEPLLHVPEFLIQFRVHDSSTTSFNHQTKWMHVRYIERTRLFLKYLSSEHFSPLRKRLSVWPASLFLKTQAEIFLRRVRIEVGKQQNTSWQSSYKELLAEYDDTDVSATRNYYILGLMLLLARIGLFFTWRSSIFGKE